MGYELATESILHTILAGVLFIVGFACGAWVVGIVFLILFLLLLAFTRSLLLPSSKNGKE